MASSKFVYTLTDISSENPKEQAQKYSKLINELLPNLTVKGHRIFTYTVSNLSTVFQNYPTLLSNVKGKEKIWVVSLGMGQEAMEVPLLLEKYGDKLIYVGLDNDEKCIDTAKQIYKKFNNIHFVKTDASSNQEIIKSLQHDKLIPPNGFQKIILRQPNIFFQQEAFTKMLENSIPYIASQDATLLISCFDIKEAAKIWQILSKEFYSKESNFFECRTDGNIKKYDQYSYIVNCKGLAFKMQRKLNNGFEYLTLSEISIFARVNKACSEKARKVLKTMTQPTLK